jgi:hypothetical protein
MTGSRLEAQFVLGSDGSPLVVADDKTNHYEIQLRVAEPPPGTYAVTYQLHDTYYDPVRESRSREQGFAEEITSYGDFEVQARVRGKDRTVATASLLSEALRRGHAGGMNESIERAIREIQKR